MPIAAHWLPAIIKRFQADYPGIRYEFLLGDYAEIEQWIFEGRVDCGFLRLPTKPGYETISLAKDEYVAVLPLDHPLTAKDVLCPQDLNGQPFMLLEHGGKTEISEYLEAHQIKPDVRFTTWDDYAVLSMVESGLGIGVLPRLILQRIPYSVEVRSFSESLYREIGLAMRNSKAAPASVRNKAQSNSTARGAASLYVGGVFIRTPRNTHDLVDNSLCQRWSKAICLNIYRKILLNIQHNATIIKNTIREVNLWLQ